jgi:hypothetical protein
MFTESVENLVENFRASRFSFGFTGRVADCTNLVRSPARRQPAHYTRIGLPHSTAI